MDSFEEILQAGGHANSLGRAREILDLLQHDPTRLGELFKCISHEDAWVRMRAIDTFEKLIKEKPDLAKPYLEDIFSTLTKSTQPSIQWHLAQLFMEVELNEEQRDKAIEWLKNSIRTVDVDWIVSVNTMKALIYFQTQGFIEKRELIPFFNVQLEHSSKSVRKKTANLLQKLS